MKRVIRFISEFIVFSAVLLSVLMVFAPSDVFAEGTVDVNGSVIWVDDNNTHGRRPDHITVTLYANGNSNNSSTIQESDSWSFNFSSNQAQDENRDVITYTVGGEEVSGYDCEVTALSSNSFQIVYTLNTSPTIHTVTYRVVNGKWNDDTTGDKSETTEDNGHLFHIPAVGNKPSSGFKAGSWSPSTPTNETVITDDTTFTYTYAQDEPTPPSPTVYNVTVTTDGHGEAYANKRSGVSGTKVMLKEVPDDGYRFKQWEVISGGVELDNYRDYTTSFTIKSAHVEIKAHFEKKEEHTRENDYESKSEAAWTPAKAAATIAVEKAAKQEAASRQMAVAQTLLRTLATTKPTNRPEEARKVIGLDMTKVDILDPATVNLLTLNSKFAYNIKISVAGGLTNTVTIPANFNFRPFIKEDGTMNIHEVLWSIILSRK